MPPHFSHVGIEVHSKKLTRQSKKLTQCNWQIIYLLKLPTMMTLFYKLSVRGGTVKPV